MSDTFKEEIEEMTKLLKESFGVADSETVTENSYSFKGKKSEMREDIAFMKALEREESNGGRLYLKNKHGFDYEG